MREHGTRGSGRNWDYDGGEIVADGVIHGLGLVLAGTGCIAFLGWRLSAGSGPDLVSHLVYCLSLLFSLTVSAAYNMWPVTPFKWALRRIDHAMIFALIAGTYTPFLVRAGRGETTALLVAIWVVSALGMVLKTLDLQHREWMSTMLYVVLGWSGVLVLGPLAATLPEASFALLLTGGGLYSAGVAFHHWRSLRFQNAIWHGFVLLGAVCHFFAILTAVRGQ
jgi:hemolysin III